jgi:hypothetical protein
MKYLIPAGPSRVEWDLYLDYPTQSPACTRRSGRLWTP